MHKTMSPLTSTWPLIIEVPSPPVLRLIVLFVSFSAISSQVKSNVHALSVAHGGRQHWVFWFHVTTLSLPYVSANIVLTATRTARTVPGCMLPASAILVAAAARFARPQLLPF